MDLGETEIVNKNSQEPDDSKSPALAVVSDLPDNSLKMLATFSDEQDSRIASILWLRGYSVVDIAEVIKKSTGDVIKILKDTRAQIAEWHKDELENIRAERIEGFRQVQRKAWNEYNSLDAKPGSRLTALQVIAKAEEAIARMQGVVEQKIKHSGNVDHRHKLYDFDNSGYKPAEVVEISEDEN